MSIQVKKIISGRKRFIKTLPLKNPEEWGPELLLLKNLLHLHSSFQLVGTKVYMEVSSDGFSLMLEVIGVPQNPDQKSLIVTDQEAGDILVHKIEGHDLFNLDFEGLLHRSKSIHATLDRGERSLSPVFHIVFDNEKIELHFFRQKDYIQNLL